MKIKLIDVEHNGHLAEVGSCELCFGVLWVNEPVYKFEVTSEKFELENKPFEVDAYDWSWGHYDEIDIDNVVEFADYLNSNEFLEVDTEDDIEQRLFDILNEFQYSRMNSDTYTVNDKF